MCCACWIAGNGRFRCIDVYKRQGTYLFNIGLGAKIGLFYAMQGIVSLFMPAIMGSIADRWVPAQKLYGFCPVSYTHLYFSASCSKVSMVMRQRLMSDNSSIHDGVSWKHLSRNR